MDVSKELKSLGFATNEAKAYLALLRCQPATAYEIAKIAGLPTSKIYETVAQLAGDQLDPRIKNLNYLNQITAKTEANVARADEAVMLNQSGFVAEGTADNIFIVTGDTLETPSVTGGALNGITRGLILELSNMLSIPARERSLTTYNL